MVWRLEYRRTVRSCSSTGPRAATRPRCPRRPRCRPARAAPWYWLADGPCAASSASSRAAAWFIGGGRFTCRVRVAALRGSATERADHRERELQDADEARILWPQFRLCRPVDVLVHQAADLFAQVRELRGGQVEQPVAELVSALPLGRLGRPLVQPSLERLEVPLGEDRPEQARRPGEAGA